MADEFRDKDDPDTGRQPRTDRGPTPTPTPIPSTDMGQTGRRGGRKHFDATWDD